MIKKYSQGSYVLSLLSATLFLSQTPLGINAQNPFINFYLPDSVCVDDSVNIVNLTTNGTTFYWSFCNNEANGDPIGINLGNPLNKLDVPTYISLAQQDNNCFGFISCQGIPGIVRVFFGSSFTSTPVDAVSLGDFGVLTADVEGIQIISQDGHWIGFVNNSNTIVRFDFGSSLWAIPSVAVLGPFPEMNIGHGLFIIKENSTWIGFATCTVSGVLLRLNFGNSLLNTPTYENLGNLANFNYPNQIGPVYENQNWYLFAANGMSNTFSRINFGNSLLNSPTGINLGNPGGFYAPLGLIFKTDCGKPTAYFSEYLVNGQIGRIDFPNGTQGNPVSNILGNIGELERPHSYSNFFRTGDTLYNFLMNRGTGSITRYSYPPCNNPQFPSSTQFSPPVLSFNQTGTYMVHLLVNEGQPNQVSLCKQITVLDKLPPSTVTVDTLLCYGVPYFAGGAWRIIAGVYYDTIHATVKCKADSIIKTILNYKPEIKLYLGQDTTICFGWPYLLDATVPEATYLWQDGSTDSIYAVSEPGKYWVTVTKDDCSKTDSIHFGDCPAAIWFPNVFTPNGDGLNDTYHPVAVGIDKYQIIIFNRWGEKLFESSAIEPGWDGTFKGALCPDGVYIFISTYKTIVAPDVVEKAQGSITLIR